jgi:hypothetical protein
VKLEAAAGAERSRSKACTWLFKKSCRNFAAICASYPLGARRLVYGGAKAGVSMRLLSVPPAGCAQENFGTVRNIDESRCVLLSNVQRLAVRSIKGAEYAFQVSRYRYCRSCDDGEHGWMGRKFHCQEDPWAHHADNSSGAGHRTRSIGIRPGHLKRKSGSESASQFTPSHRTTGTR